MEGSIFNGKPLHSLKVVELKEWLQKRGIKTSGMRKADLIKRYIIFI